MALAPDRQRTSGAGQRTRKELSDMQPSASNRGAKDTYCRKDSLFNKAPGKTACFYVEKRNSISYILPCKMDECFNIITIHIFSLTGGSDQARERGGGEWRAGGRKLVREGWGEPDEQRLSCS